VIHVDRVPLDKAEIEKIVKDWSGDRYRQNLQYYKGGNTNIMTRKMAVGASDIKVPIPYARKIINTVTGYMYKPGLITYPDIPDNVLKIFDDNDEPMKTAALGKQTSIQGVGYEIHYTDGDVKGFAKEKAENMIPLYDYSIDPELVAAIRISRRGEDERYFVYYADVVQEWEKREASKDLYMVDETPHLYGQVPVVVYENNEEHIGDFEPVKNLIDAYDILASDSMNEFDRFAMAYMILKGYNASDDIDNMKQKRIFGVTEEGAVEFLTKDIPSEFIQFMSGWIRKEIHKQSHVPDFLEAGATGDALSGVAIDKLLYDFEFIAATKQALFESGLRKRLELIDPGLRDIEIVFDRNKPQYLIELAQTMQIYAGHISQGTLLKNFAPFVDDVDEEMALIQEEGNLYEPSEREDIQEDIED